MNPIAGMVVARVVDLLKAGGHAALEMKPESVLT